MTIDEIKAEGERLNAEAVVLMKFGSTELPIYFPTLAGAKTFFAGVADVRICALNPQDAVGSGR